MNDSTTLDTAPDPTRVPPQPTSDERAVAGLAWLAATFPPLAAQDLLHGNDVIALTVYGSEVVIHLRDVDTARRVAARLDLTSWVDLVDDDARQQWWTGQVGDVNVRVVHCYTFPADEPAATNLYRCAHCGAAFGITGQSTGSDDDREADEHYAAEVARHESGECTQAVTQ